MKKQIVAAPEYFHRFACKGSACSDNCCIGWEIDVDKTTLKKYGKVGGTLGKKLAENIVKDGEVSHFSLNCGRCPFLNNQNLCDIIINLGEGMLCDICREHPRFYTKVGDVLYCGVGLSCEAAAELVLSEREVRGYVFEDTEVNNKHLEDNKTEDNKKADKPAECNATEGDVATNKETAACVTDDNLTDDYEARVASIVNEAVRAVDKQVFDCGDNLALALEAVKNTVTEYGQRLDALVYGDGAKIYGDGCEPYTAEYSRETYEGYADAVSMLLGLEYLTNELCERISRVKPEDVSAFYNKNPKFLRYVYRLFAHFCSRHTVSLMNDGDAYGALSVVLYLTFTSVLLSASGDATFDFAVKMAKLVSREIEYNEDNILALAKNDTLTADAFIELIKDLI